MDKIIPVLLKDYHVNIQYRVRINRLHLTCMAPCQVYQTIKKSRAGLKRNALHLYTDLILYHLSMGINNAGFLFNCIV